MILSDIQIEAAIHSGEIVVSPFDPNALRVNSYDVHLGRTLLVSARQELDAAVAEQWDALEIPTRGIVLAPGRLYLAATREYTESHIHVPYLDGKSSVGRLGCFIHATAGRGDVGFCGHWTMEISVVQPLRIYAGMPIGQLTWHECGAPSAPYDHKAGSNFMPGSHATERPVPSTLWKKLQAPVEEVFYPCVGCGDLTRHVADVSCALADVASDGTHPLCMSPACRAKVRPR